MEPALIALIALCMGCAPAQTRVGQHLAPSANQLILLRMAYSWGEGVALWVARGGLA